MENKTYGRCLSTRASREDANNINESNTDNDSLLAQVKLMMLRVLISLLLTENIVKLQIPDLG